MPRSRSTASTGVPTSADIASLSNTGSSATGASSATIRVCAASGGKVDLTASARSVRCHAIAVRSAPTPRCAGGSDTWRTYSTIAPAARAASRTVRILAVTPSASCTWARMPT